MELVNKDIFIVRFENEKNITQEDRQIRDIMVHELLSNSFDLGEVITNDDDTVGYTKCGSVVVTNVINIEETVENPFLVVIADNYRLDTFVENFNNIFNNGNDKMVKDFEYIFDKLMNNEIVFENFTIFDEFLLANLTKDNVLDKVLKYGKDALTEVDYKVLEL